MLFEANRTCLCTVLVKLGRDDDEHGTLKTSIKGDIDIHITGEAKRRSEANSKVTSEAKGRMVSCHCPPSH